MRKRSLGELLINKGIIDQTQLHIALREQKEKNELLGKILARLGFIKNEQQILSILAEQIGVDCINLDEVKINDECIKAIPAKTAIFYNVICFDMDDDTVSLAIANPKDIQILDEVATVIKKRVKPYLCFKEDIRDAINSYYGVGAGTIENMMEVKDVFESNVEDAFDDKDSVASISRFMNEMLLEAYRSRVTDIHIEPYEQELKVRYRIDGVLYDIKVPEHIRFFQEALFVRIKILCSLDISEKRKPQDGRFKAAVDQQELDLRVSFLPTSYGQSVVIRLLNSLRLLNLNELGFAEEDIHVLTRVIDKPHGIIFVTGPTGSGKSTTLYSFLSQLNAKNKKIITLEDPIEYRIKGITQMQVKPDVGLSFANGLRSMLRHDPDVMMVGEIRDAETAHIAIQVALTGHLVLSTLHTNDACGGVVRLIDIGIEPFLVSSSTLCFLSQRLVRILCPHCKEKTEISEAMARTLEIPAEKLTQHTLYHSVGCETCRMTGFIGREAIYELLMINDEIAELIAKGTNASELKRAAVKNGMQTIVQNGLEKVYEGKTTVEEILRVAH